MIVHGNVGVGGQQQGLNQTLGEFFSSLSCITEMGIIRSVDATYRLENFRKSFDCHIEGSVDASSLWSILRGF